MPLDQDQFREGGGLMSFGAHLDELRSRLIWALAIPVVIATVAFTYSQYIVDFVKRPLMEALSAEGFPPVLQVLSPSEVVLVKVQLSIWAAVILAVPWILWQIWRFVAPGLYAQERRYARFLVPLSTALVIVGLTGFYLALPWMLRMLIQFGEVPPQTVPSEAAMVQPVDGATTPPSDAPAVAKTPLGNVPVLDDHPKIAKPGDVWIWKKDRQIYLAMENGRPDNMLELRTVPTQNAGEIAQQFRLSEYIDFVLFFSAAIAVAFQMPVAVLLLGWLGILDIVTLRRYRRHAFFICAIAAAVITPTVDIFSMLALLIPLYLLYEFGIILLHVAPAQAVAEGGVVSNTLRAMVGRRKYRNPRHHDEGEE